jgi:hypothetical protein
MRSDNTYTRCLFIFFFAGNGEAACTSNCVGLLAQIAYFRNLCPFYRMTDRSNRSLSQIRGIYSIYVCVPIEIGLI